MVKPLASFVILGVKLFGILALRFCLGARSEELEIRVRRSGTAPGEIGVPFVPIFCGLDDSAVVKFVGVGAILFEAAHV